jgi:hypothetical protein
MIQCAVSLIVSNLAVVVTCVYRFTRNSEDTDPASDDTLALNATKPLSVGGHERLSNRTDFKLNATHASP